MAFELLLAKTLAKAGWKIKIRDKERLEEPHVTIIKGTKSWRIGLRSGELLDLGRWKDLPDTLVKALEQSWDVLRQEWDRMYPHNPVESARDESNEND